jgi:hypothetical protein
MREFKDGISGKAGSIEDEDEERPALNASNSASSPAASAEATRSEQPSGSADRPTEVGSSEPRS